MGEEQRPAWWKTLKENSQFEHLTYEDAVILFRGRNLDPEATLKELLPVLRTAPWAKVRQYGEAIWFGWQLDDVNKRKKPGIGKSDRADAEKRRTATRDRIVAEYKKQIAGMTREDAVRLMEKVSDNLHDVVAEGWVWDEWKRGSHIRRNHEQHKRT